MLARKRRAAAEKANAAAGGPVRPATRATTSMANTGDTSGSEGTNRATREGCNQRAGKSSRIISLSDLPDRKRRGKKPGSPLQVDTDSDDDTYVPPIFQPEIDERSPHFRPTTRPRGI